MSNFGTVFVTLIPIFLLIALGYGAGRRGFFDRTTERGLNTFVISFALPASFFVGVVTNSRQTLLSDVPTLLVLVLATVGFFLAVLAILRYALHLGLAEASIIALCSAMPTFAFMGIPVLGNLYGSAQVAAPLAMEAIIVNAILVPIALIFVHAGMSESAGKEEKAAAGFLSQVASAFKQPIAWAPLLATILVLVGVSPPAFINDTLRLLGEATSGVALLLVGVLMSFERLKFSRAALGITFLKGIAQPAVAMLLALLIGLQSPLYTETVLIVAFSSSPVAVLLASRYRTRETDTASALVATAVLSIVTLPLLMLITT